MPVTQVAGVVPEPGQAGDARAARPVVGDGERCRCGLPVAVGWKVTLMVQLALAASDVPQLLLCGEIAGDDDAADGERDAIGGC